MTNSMTDNTTSEAGVLVFNIGNNTVFMYDDGQFWVNLKPVWQWLGPLERAYLLSCSWRIMTDDIGRDTYVSFDDFFSICPADTQAILITQRKQLLEIVGQEGE